MRRWPTLVLVALASSMFGAGLALAQPRQPQPVPPGLRGCKAAGEASDYLGGREFRVQGSSGVGTEFHVVAAPWKCDGQPNNVQYYRYGVSGAPDGVAASYANQVPARYDDVAPFSHSLYMVKRINNGPWVLYRRGRGETGGPLPYTDVVALRSIESCEARSVTAPDYSPTVFAGLTAPGPDGKRNAVIYTGDEVPATISGLGGPGVDTPIERHRDLLIGRWKDPDGTLRHRIYSLGGRPLSPVLGDVTRWATVLRVDDRRLNLPCYQTDSIELLITGPLLDEFVSEEGAYWGPLYTPLGPDGAPLPLPPGAIGVMPVTPYRAAKAPTPKLGLYAPYRQTRVWGVVYPAEKGFTFTLFEGPLSGAIAAAPTARRFSTMYRSAPLPPDSPTDASIIFRNANTALVGQDAKDGRWYGFLYMRSEVGGSGADYDAALASIQAAAAADTAAWQADQARQKAEALAAYEQSLASGAACAYTPPWNLPKTMIERHAAQCPHRYNLDDLNRLKSGGYAQASIAAVETNRAQAYDREQAYRAEQAELQRSYVPPGAWEGALRAASDAQVRGIQQSTQNWLDQRRDQYNADWQRSQRGY